MRRVSAFAFCFLLLCACGREKTPVYAPAEVIDLRRDLAEYKALDSVGRGMIMSADSLVLDAFMKVVSGEPVSDALVEGWSNSRQVEMFTPPTDSVFPDVALAANALGAIRAKADEEGLTLPEYTYAAVVYGRPESVLFVDSVMFVALNHYLGADFEGYSHIPVYMRLSKTPEMLPYDLAEALVATAYPYGPTEETTVLSRLLYEGALTEMKMRLVPDSEERLALGYTPEQFRWLCDNEKRLWDTLVGRQILYDTSSSLARQLVSPSPATRLLDSLAPGRAGRFIGYRIVRAYLDKHPDVSPEYLLSKDFTDSDATLIDASYAP